MSPLITNEIVEGYLACRLKGFLKSHGEAGSPNEYVAFRSDSRRRVSKLATDRLLSDFADLDDLGGRPVTVATLKRGVSVLLNVAITTSDVDLRADALLKTTGTSRLGDYHYIPVLFHETERPRTEQKILLQVVSSFLAEMQGRAPSCAHIVNGSSTNGVRVSLKSKAVVAATVLRDIREMQGGHNSPRLIINPHCSVCEFQCRCRNEAIAKDDLSLLRTLREKEIANLNKKGIFTVTQLSYTFRPRRSRKRSAITAVRHHAALQALALRTDTIYVGRKPEIPDEPGTCVFLDIEGVPDSSFYYLIGLRILEGGRQQDLSFWADAYDDERHIWEMLLRELAAHDKFLVFHYGAFDSDALDTLAHRYGGDPALLSRLSSACVNVLSWVYGHIYFPTYSNDLKSLASCLGFKWSDAGASGLNSLAWRGRWELTGEDKYKTRLLRYNHEDCVALQTVADAIRAIANADNLSDLCLQKRAADAHQAAGRGWPNIYRRNEFFFTSLDRINRCAYFDYQRERVFVRTSPEVRASTRRERRMRSKSVRINRTIEAPRPSVCPHCGAAKIIRHGQIAKRIHDLKLFRGGVKRWNVKIVSHRYVCGDCGKYFQSEGHPSTKYGNTLQAWCVYQNIALLRSHGSIVEEMRTIFGYEYSGNIACWCKSSLAKLFEPTHRQIIERLRSGRLLHADETKVSIKGKVGWVWAFTNLEEVAFIYSESRDASVAEAMLKGFRGVLVSDFYAAYDSPECAQQKCLIHLIREINDDLFKNPFDDELKAIAAEFTELLCLVVDTVDRYGLRFLHLRKHEAQAARFLNRVAERRFTSEPAQTYQRRFQRDGSKLFTFLKYDGVPWNNNNAENAIKRFAFLRRVIGGSSTKKGMEEYLILLSIRETLRRKGVSFLNFLRAREPDLDECLRVSSGNR